jgi:hypothetical protein
MVLLDLADADWFPLVMVLGLGVVMYILYRSMRHEMGKITVPDDAQKPDDAADR